MLFMFTMITSLLLNELQISLCFNENNSIIAVFREEPQSAISVHSDVSCAEWLSLTLYFSKTFRPFLCKYELWKVCLFFLCQLSLLLEIKYCETNIVIGTNLRWLVQTTSMLSRFCCFIFKIWVFWMTQFQLKSKFLFSFLSLLIYLFCVCVLEHFQSWQSCGICSNREKYSTTPKPRL